MIRGYVCARDREVTSALRRTARGDPLHFGASSWTPRLPQPAADYLEGTHARCARGLSTPVGANVRGWGIWPVDGARASVVRGSKAPELEVPSPQGAQAESARVARETSPKPPVKTRFPNPPGLGLP